jgi:hypothetical protein
MLGKKNILYSIAFACKFLNTLDISVICRIFCVQLINFRWQLSPMQNQDKKYIVATHFLSFCHQNPNGIFFD